MMTSKEILSMNLKYYRYKYVFSQEKFAKKIGTNLVYLNQLENCKRKTTVDMLDKITRGINRIDSSLNLTSSDLIKYDELHRVEFSRIDEVKRAGISSFYILYGITIF